MDEIEGMKKEKDILQYFVKCLKKENPYETLNELLKLKPNNIINDVDIERLEKPNNLLQFIKITNNFIGNICILSKLFCQICNIIDSDLDNFDFDIEKNDDTKKLKSIQYFCVELIKNYENLDFVIESINEKVIRAINLISYNHSSKIDNNKN